MVNYNIIYQQNINSLFPLIFTNEKCQLVTTEGITFGNEKKKWCVIILDRITDEIFLSVTSISKLISNI
jgi:hypothetical protein